MWTWLYKSIYISGSSLGGQYCTSSVLICPTTSLLAKSLRNLDKKIRNSEVVILTRNSVLVNTEDWETDDKIFHSKKTLETISSRRELYRCCRSGVANGEVRVLKSDDMSGFLLFLYVYSAVDCMGQPDQANGCLGIGKILFRICLWECF